MNLGENIYRLRTERNLSQGDLADALDVSRQSVSKWENNSATPELEKLLKMAELFGVTLDTLVGRTEPDHPSAPEPSREPPAQVPVPPYKTLGAVLLGFGLVADLILSILGGFILGVLIGMPFIVAGCILMTSTMEALFRTAWGLFAVYAPIVFFFTLLFMGIGMPIRYGIIAVWLAALVLWALSRHRRGKLSKESKKFIIGSLILSVILSILLSFGTAIYYFQTGLQTHTQELDAYVTEIEPD